jgi:tRNA (cytidine/uridine-2'-O-)-methyltransferase
MKEGAAGTATVWRVALRLRLRATHGAFRGYGDSRGSARGEACIMPPMLHIALFEPEIPPNTGNIMRLCANTGCTLHLIEPLGFSMDERKLRRAGLDYREFATVKRHDNWRAFLSVMAAHRIWAFTTKGSRPHTDVAYREDDVLLFGPETRGLPDELLASMDAGQRLRIPMLPQRRSLNLANAAAIAVFEAWRQLDFSGAQ